MLKWRQIVAEGLLFCVFFGCAGDPPVPPKDSPPIEQAIFRNVVIRINGEVANETLRWTQGEEVAVSVTADQKHSSTVPDPRDSPPKSYGSPVVEICCDDGSGNTKVVQVISPGGSYTPSPKGEFGRVKAGDDTPRFKIEVPPGSYEMRVISRAWRVPSDPKDCLTLWKALVEVKQASRS